MPAVAEGARPRSLLMTLFGAFLRDVGDWIAVADLIGLLAPLALDEQAVRSAISRLKRRDVVAAERRQGAAGYRLTPRGRAILDAGDARIFAPAPAGLSAPAPDWVLLLFSIPEAERALRHRLRSRLGRLGLGRVGAAAWIGPPHVAAEVRLLVSELDAGAYVELFDARHLGLRATADAVARWWDLAAIEAEYRAYLTAWAPRLEAWRAGGGEDPAAAFRDYLLQLDAWRRIPYHDPGLPAVVLPPAWPGRAAWAVFGELSRSLRPGALRHVEERVLARAAA